MILDEFMILIYDKHEEHVILIGFGHTKKMLLRNGRIICIRARATI